MVPKPQIAFLLISAAACAPRLQPVSALGTLSTHPQSAGAAVSQNTTEAPRRVRLVVSVVLDQLPSWALERYLPHLSADGAIRLGIERGAFFTKSRYESAATYTAAGHATLYTGAQATVHGVQANEVWHYGRSRAISVVDDGASAVIGDSTAFASPAVLRAPTVADVLEKETQGGARTVSLSFKDRASVLAGGQRPDLALWYDTKRGEFTTSSYYALELPGWLKKWHERNPVQGFLREWVAAEPERLQALLGPDEGLGEGNWQGLGKTFPHDPRRSPQPLSAFRATPMSTDLLLELARACVLELELGVDSVPDLLLLSISATDYVGHIFGAESWEYVDNLKRTDAALARFLGELERRTDLAVLITSDHGVAPLPERAQVKHPGAVRVWPEDLAASLNRVLSKRFRFDQPMVEAFVQPFIYLSPAVRSSSQRSVIVAAALDELSNVPGVATAVDAASRLPAKPQSEELMRHVRASIASPAPGDIFIVTTEHSVVDAGMPRGAGTNHGSPWDYDQFVPVVIWGDAVPHHLAPNPVDVRRVAATLASLLGVPPPARALRATLLNGP